MEALLDATPLELPKSLVEHGDRSSWCERAAADLQARGVKPDKVPLDPADLRGDGEAPRGAGPDHRRAGAQRKPAAEARRGARAGRAGGGELRESRRGGEMVLHAAATAARRWKALALEDNVVDWVLAKAKVVDKPVAFDELMGEQHDMNWMRQQARTASREGLGPDPDGDRADGARRARLRHLLAPAEGARGVPGRARSTEITANLIVAQLLFLESENPDKDIFFYINSPGGSVSAGLAIYDTMQFIKPDVSHAVRRPGGQHGRAAARGRRQGQALLPAELARHDPPAHGRLLRARPRTSRSTPRKSSTCAQRLNEILAKHTGQTIETIERDTDRDIFMGAEEAVKYGLVDKVLTCAARAP